MALKGEILDNLIMTQAADLVSRADTLLVVGCNLMSSLGSLVKYFNGRIVALINNEAHYSDHKADCICIGNISDIMKQVYPAEAGQQKMCIRDRGLQDAAILSEDIRCAGFCIWQAVRRICTSI